jgi:serine/threonine protein kinase
MRGSQVAELRVVGEYRGPGERLTAETLAQRLPDDWVLIANRSLPTQEHDDLDLTVIGHNLVFIVEDKYWGPVLRVGPGPWLVKRSVRANPTDRVSFLARKLAGLLRNRVPAYPRKGHVVKSFVVLSNPAIQVDWSDAGPESDMVVLLEDAADVLIDEDTNASTSLGGARDAAIAFLDGWKERSRIPESIGAYKVLQEIPPLGRARVFAARDDVNQLVLLKCYPMDGWGPGVDPSNLIRRERKALQKVAESGRTLESQPVFEDQLHRWIVVSIVQRPLMSLPRLLAMEAPPIHPATSDGADIVRLVTDAFEGLRAIHRLRVLHRGIAPTRVSLDADFRVRFTDLNMAQVSGEATVAPSLNELADVSVPFRAPECKEFIGAATPASDIYSLALSLLWWLVGDARAHPDPAADPSRNDLAGLAAVLRLCLVPGPSDRSSLDEVLEMLTALVPAFAPGEMIANRWRIERALGEGGYARSWLAMDVNVDQRRVLKHYSEGVPKETAKKEFDAASQLIQERCARVWDISFDPAFLVVEYVPGESLRAAASAPISPDKYRVYALDILSALAYMHDHDRLHNDVSPGNIIIEPEGRARLIDFGLSRLRDAKTQVHGTPNFSAPEVLAGKLSPASDLYGLGATFLYSMLGRHSFEVNELGALDKSVLKPLSTDERSTLGPLGIAIAEQFFRLVVPSVDARPASAREFAEDLQRTTPIDVPAGGENINETVDSLRRLYRGSKLGNAGNRGLDDPFANATYIPTLLDKTLTSQIINGDINLAVLTGNPGDGKTSYLKRLKGQLLAAGAAIETEGAGGWLLVTADRTFAAVYDASEARDGKTSDDLVIEALDAARPGLPHTTLLAINDGRLRQFFTENADLYPEYHRAIKTSLAGGLPDPASRVAYVDLKRRSLAPTAADPDGIAGRTLDSFTDESRWEVCATCTARDVCPILRNRTQLAGPGRVRLLDLVAISHLRRQRRATFRDFRSAAAWIITGDRGCQDIHEARRSGIDLRRGDDALHFDLAFDPRSTDYLIAEWSEVDPTLLPVAALERGYGAAPDTEVWHRRASLNRRAFFDDLSDVSHIAEATPYRYLRDFQAALATDCETESMLPRILLGLSRLLGAFGYDGRNLALQDGEHDGWAVLREIPADEFTLERRALVSPYVEEQADELVLKHPRATLNLTLDSVELILRAADGAIINDAAANAIKIELSMLAEQLMLHSATAALVVNPAGVPVSINASEGTISMGEAS